MQGVRAPDIELYRGYPVIKIWTGKVWKGEEEYIILGLRKAIAVCDQIDYIRRFVDQAEGKKY